MDLPTGVPAADPASAPPPPPPSAPPTLPPAPPGVELDRARGATPAAGQLVLGWRAVTGLAWALAFVSLIAVWKTSRELGLSTWWLGPVGEPAPWYVAVLPFVPCAAMVLLVLNNSRWLPWAGLAGAAWLGAVGAVDLGRVPRLGIVEVVVAAAVALVALAGFGGRYRRLDR